MAVQANSDGDEAPCSDIRGLILLNLDKLVAKLSVSKPMIYKLVRTARFPRPLKIGERSVWIQAEVDEWIEARAAERAPPSV